MAKIKCPICRGSKVMMKLGGMEGKCNKCLGVGEIDPIDKPLTGTVVFDMEPRVNSEINLPILANETHKLVHNPKNHKKNYKSKTK